MSMHHLIAVTLASLQPHAVWLESASTGTSWGATLPRVFRAERADDPVVVDGILDDRSWTGVRTDGQFWQRDPDEGAPAEFPTRFGVLYDDEALYVGVYATDPEPERIAGLLTRRDEESSSDWIMVGLDSYHDRRTAFVFGINPVSVEVDYLLYDDVQKDASWDAVWDGAAHVDGNGWSAEFRIPLSQLRFSTDLDQVWGLQVRRLVQRTREESCWTPWPKNSTGVVRHFGELSGINDIEPGNRLELLPYGVGGVGLVGAEMKQGLWGLGADLKYGLSSNFTLSASVNPDFGQVEADPSEVNLTGQESFFAEKRPFFLEGADILRFNLGQGDGDGAHEQLFYSRRIGAPAHEPPTGTVVSVDDNTTIYGATKVTGKTSAGWSLGLLNAVTAEELGEVEFDDGSVEEQILEPLTSYSVVRLRKDFRQGRTTAGLGLTGVHRRLTDTGIDWLHEQAYAGGIDFSHRFLDDDWMLQSKVFASTVLGDPAAITETQQSAQRYYQRPDARHLKFNPDRTSLSGMAAQYVISRYGDSIRGAIGGDFRSPGFEVNDLGFERRADSAIQWAWLQFRDDQPGALLRQWSVNANTWASADWSPQLLNVGGNVNAHSTLDSYWTVGGAVGYNHNHWAANLLRGGPLPRGDPSWWSNLSVGSDSRQFLYGNVAAMGTRQVEGNSWSTELTSTLTLQAVSSLRLSIGPTWKRNVSDNQYVDAVEDNNENTRYILGRIDQSTLGLTLRVSYNVTPTLSLQAYAQPFLSAGRYAHYKTVADPKARDHDRRFHRISDGEVNEEDGVLAVDADGDGLSDYQFTDADFRFRELRSNIVLRWEYLAGSALFVIWSHGRSSDDGGGGFDVGDEMATLGRESGEHVFMVKLSYWMGS